ncbi:septum formation initiator family protein [Leuconostocaceae bacterium ESL0958]|nr:septum formation initiator family protein [Leuconostocaceae bacterium ESL0958]
MAERNAQSNIRPLNANIAQQIAATEARRHAKTKHYTRLHRQRRKRIVWVGLAITAIFAFQLILGQVRLHAANQVLTKSQNSYQAVAKDHQSLKKNVDQLNDPNYLQQILRDKYGYSRQGEIVYNLPDQK